MQSVDKHRRLIVLPYKVTADHMLNHAGTLSVFNGVIIFVHVCVRRFSLVWGSSSWRRRWRRSRLGIVTRAASLLSAMTPSRPTVTEVRKGLHWAPSSPLSPADSSRAGSADWEIDSACALLICFWLFCWIWLPLSVVVVGNNWPCSCFQIQHLQRKQTHCRVTEAMGCIGWALALLSNFSLWL